MSKHTLAVTIRIAVLALASFLSVSGCGNKKSQDKPAAGGSQGGAAPATPAAANSSATPGVTATEIKIGQSVPFSGPASAFGVIAKGEAAYFKMINDKGGINGRKLTLISLDDGYYPPKAVENTRKLVENEGVAVVFNSLGTAANSAVQKYLNDKKVPQLFVASGADKWADPQHFPFTMGFAPSYRAEAKLYAKWLLKEKPAAKLCVLYQNDDFGKDYLRGLKEGFGDKNDAIVVKTMSYEIADTTIDTQVVSLQGAGCDTLLTAATPKFAAQTIRKVFDINWKPLHIMSNTAVSRKSVLEPAGLDKAKGLVTAGYLKDITDPALADDPGLNEYRAFAKDYLQGMDWQTDGALVYAFGVSMALVKVLTQCGSDLSRENIMKQAASLKDLQLPVIAPGILINTSATDYQPYAQLQFGRFNGNNFDPFAEVQAAE
ncbi:MAG TPA: ABC transporter substrate-binding protein [Kofleriaceae bacterium]|nr:ABC transporter substrate-binding protein [Kofleriaceae bacterium]